MERSRFLVQQRPTTSNPNSTIRKPISTPNPIPRNFWQAERMSLAQRTRLKSFKCNQIGHVFRRNRETNRPDLRVNVTTGRLPTVVLRSNGQRHKFLVDSGAEINILKRRCVLQKNENSRWDTRDLRLTNTPL